jgi:plasmid maintenance system killer protein
MIQSFKCKETAKIFNDGFSQKFPANIMKTAIIRLAMLNRSGKLNDLRIPPSNRLEKLLGNINITKMSYVTDADSPLMFYRGCTDDCQTFNLLDIRHTFLLWTGYYGALH